MKIFVRIFVRIVVSLGEKICDNICEKICDSICDNICENICENFCLPRGEEGSSSAGALRRLHLHHLLLPSSKGKKNFDTLIMRVKD